MSRFKGFVCLILIIEVVLVLLCNGIYIHQSQSDTGRLYRVETARVAREIEEQNLTVEQVEAMDLSAYETIVKVTVFRQEETCNNDYVVEEINDNLYRIEYRANRESNIIIWMNIALVGMILITVAVLLYVYRKVLKPFHAMSNLSYELAKGNLSTPVKEEKSKLFGRFLWGMDMLREKLEDNKEKELEFQKDRKTLILSLSHDILLHHTLYL